METREEDYTFEHLGFWEPKWVKTQGSNNLKPGVHDVAGMDAPAFSRPDFFHIFHAGVGKDYLGSSLVYSMKALFGLGGVDRDLKALNEALRTFLRLHGKTLHLGATLNEDHLGYAGTRKYPAGHWSKSMDTATLMKFQVWLLQREEYQERVRGDQMLFEILFSGIAMGQVMRRLLGSLFIVSSEDCEYVITSGHEFSPCLPSTASSLRTQAENSLLQSRLPYHERPMAITWLR